MSVQGAFMNKKSPVFALRIYRLGQTVSRLVLLTAPRTERPSHKSELANEITTRDPV